MAHDLLFVDDDPLFLNRCKLIFADSPYQIHFAESGADCLELIEDGLDPVVVVAGKLLGSIDTPAMLMQIHGLKPVTQLILVTCDCDPVLLTETINKSGLFRFYTTDQSDSDLKRGVIAAVSLCLHRKQSLQAAKSIVALNDELEELTFHLEKTIEYHTRKLQKSNADNIQLNTILKQTVLELEGRDRVLRHLLTIHNLENTLQTILEVIDNVLSVSCGIIYVKDDSEGLQQACIFPEDSQHPLGAGPSQLVKTVMASGRMEMDNQPAANHSSVAVPIYKEDEILGAIEIVWLQEGGRDEEELLANVQSIYTFTIHAAIAISDHRVSRDKSSWSKTLDDVLQDFMG